MLVKMVLKKLQFQKLVSLLCILLMAFGVAIISLLSNLKNQAEEQFTSSSKGIDMVIGAKGSPLQLILSAIYQIDNPTGNITLEELRPWQQNPLVKKLIPLSFGDNYQNFRIVGTSPDYIAQFAGEIASGSLFAKPMEVVLGAETAAALNLKVGQKIISAHGLDNEGDHHEEQPYTVVGILKPTHNVLDRLIICNLESIWDIHAHDHEEKTKEVTAALVSFKSPMGMMTIPRQINQNSQMQAALPSIEVNRLFELMSNALKSASILAYMIMALAGISVFISLYNSLKDQKNEKALMITLGASRHQLFFQLLLEGMILSLAGYLCGIFISYVVINIIGLTTLASFKFSNLSWQLGVTEIYLLAMTLIIGIISAAIPAFEIYKINLSKTLAKE